MPSLPLRFVLSAPQMDALGPSTAEIAVVGRSNVGKSSLINALGGSQKLALTSKTPNPLSKDWIVKESRKAAS